jgi:hypothetical protein
MAGSKRLYWIWSDMRQRCANSNHRQFADYGGRGVTVCDRWQVFANFKHDMGERPDGLSLDRRDNARGYGPDNCRWATRQEQNSNRRNCIMVDCDGERVTLKEACRRRGLTYRPIVKRIQNRGWPVSLALSTPVGAPTHFLKKQVI